MFLRPPFPQQGHHMHFFKHTAKSLSFSGLCTAPERHRQRLSAVECPMVAPSVELPATLLLLSPQTPAPALPKAGLRARHLGTSHDSCRPPASHLDIPVPFASPLYRELLCSAPQHWYGHLLLSTSPSQKRFSAGMGNQLLSVYALAGP